MSAPQPPALEPSLTAERRHRRVRHLRTTLLGCGALFAVLFTLLAAQMLLGRDPALGEGARAQTASAPAPTATATATDGRETSWVDVALGVVQALADDDEHGDDDRGAGAPLTSRSS